MSFLDNEDQDEVASQVASSAFRNVTDSIVDTHTAVVVLSIAGAAEIGGLVMLRMARYEVQRALERSDLDVWLYSAAGVFVVGFLISYAVYKMAAKKWPRPTAYMMCWLVSITAGVGNIALFFWLTGIPLY